MRAELSPYAVDPFGPSANPSAYVACEASERARGLLERSLDQGRVAALLGPPGHGKTLLLHLVGGREEDRARVAYVPFSTLELDEMCVLAMNAIGESRPGPPRDAFVEVARELAPRGGVVLLVDDAHGMSESCAAALAALYTELGGALRIALAAVQGPAAQRVVRAFGSHIDVVMLAGGMTGRESRRYVEERLAYGGARPELVAAFDEATIDALHRVSQGVPRRLNEAAGDIVRRAMRSELPRLRTLTQASAQPESAAPDATASAASAGPAPARAGPKPGALGEISVLAAMRSRAEARAQELDAAAPSQSARIPAAPRPPAPRAPVPRAPSPPPSAEEERGILLPEMFQREAGEPAGEYRIVRGTPLPASPPRVEQPPGPAARRPLGAPDTVLVAPAAETLAARHEIPMPSDYADRVPSGRSFSLRAVGIAGFVFGVAVSAAWIFSRAPDPPRVLPMTKEPTPSETVQKAPTPSETVQKAPAEVAPPTPLVEPELPAQPEVVARPEPKPEAQPAPAPPPARAPAAPRAPVLVSINATPWAIVRIDGREVGETPLAGIPIEPGVHKFEARMPDGSTREKTLEVTHSSRTVVFQ